MSDTEQPLHEDEFSLREGPARPEEDESYGAEPDDPRAAGRFADPYEVPDFDPANEERDMCTEEASA